MQQANYGQHSCQYYTTLGHCCFKWGQQKTYPHLSKTQWYSHSISRAWPIYQLYFWIEFTLDTAKMTVHFFLTVQNKNTITQTQNTITQKSKWSETANNSEKPYPLCYMFLFYFIFLPVSVMMCSLMSRFLTSQVLIVELIRLRL